MNPKTFLFAVVCVFYAMLNMALANSVSFDKSYPVLTRVKRGGGHGHGHGPGKGGGAAGPVYICGYVGKGQGYGGYGR